MNPASRVNPPGVTGFSRPASVSKEVKPIKDVINLTTGLIGKSPFEKKSKVRLQGKPLSERTVKESIGKRFLKGLRKGVAGFGKLALWLIVRVPSAMVCCVFH